MLQDLLSFQHPPGYELGRVIEERDKHDYIALLTRTYAKLGFLESGLDPFLPTANAAQYLLRCDGQTIGIFCLEEADTNSRYFAMHVPGFNDPDCRALEVKNLIIDTAFRGSVTLPLLLHTAVQYALKHNYDLLVGIARYSALRAFVDAGALPVYHPPFNLLGKANLKDFITYFDLRVPQDVAYIQQRAARLIYQHKILRALRADFLRPANVPQAAPSPDADNRTDAIIDPCPIQETLT